MKSVKLNNHYQDEIAANYEAERMHKKKWHAEHQAVDSFLASLPDQLSVIDVPAGTGRFFPLYARHQHMVHARDISDDMLASARENTVEMIPEPVIKIGDIMDLDYPENNFDIALCVRLMNLVSPDKFRTAFKELNRVSRRYIILGLRHDGGRIKQWYKPSGVMQTLRRVRLHLKGKIVVQSCDGFKRLLTDFDLGIKDKKMIDKRTDGTEYYIYLLEKKNVG